MKKPLNKELNPKLLFSFIAMINGLVTLGVSVYLGIGSNLGNKIYNIEKAKAILTENNIKIIKSSSYYETVSWPDINNPKFNNIVLKIKTNLDPNSLLSLCKSIEKSMASSRTILKSQKLP